jgi:hypothetical protein
MGTLTMASPLIEVGVAVPSFDIVIAVPDAEVRTNATVEPVANPLVSVPCGAGKGPAKSQVSLPFA